MPSKSRTNRHVPAVARMAERIAVLLRNEPSSAMRRAARIQLHTSQGGEPSQRDSRKQGTERR
jgi:hypothetical protein